MVIPLRDENPTARTAVVTLAIIAINVAVFFLVQPAGFKEFSTGFRSPAAMQRQQVEVQRFLYENAAVPCELTNLEPIDPALVEECGGGLVVDSPVAPDEPLFPGKSVLFSLLASMFLHGSILHLAGNMLFLWIFGNNVEDRVGVVTFVLFYLATGVIATFAHVATDPDSLVPVVGASGAIAGVMGAYLVFFPHARILCIVPLFFFLHFVYLPASAVLVLWFVLQFLTNPNSGVAWAAHVGGFAAGAAAAWLFWRPRRPQPTPAPR